MSMEAVHDWDDRKGFIACLSEVLPMVSSGDISQVEGARRLNISPRSMMRYADRLKEQKLMLNVLRILGRQSQWGDEFKEMR